MQSDAPEKIYLEPSCCADVSEYRHWCEDANPHQCDHATPWAEYIRSDLAICWVPVADANLKDYERVVVWRADRKSWDRFQKIFDEDVPATITHILRIKGPGYE